MKMIKGTRGFTLIELMVTVAAIAILASVAYPSYLGHIQSSRRANAKADLVELAGFMERFFTENNRYDQDLSGTATALPFNQSPQDGTAKYYNIGLVAGQTTYTLRATPIAGTPQASDGYLELLATGARRWDTNNNNAIDAGETDWEK
jgi:type IV pilus assembly protein PilE